MSMLQELLDVVSEGSLLTPAILARRFNISQELVELMLADLERKGYLRAVTGDCGSCAGCGIQQTCRPNPPRLWVRTDK